jgi:hypothetical protein
MKEETRQYLIMFAAIVLVAFAVTHCVENESELNHKEKLLKIQPADCANK